MKLKQLSNFSYHISVLVIISIAAPFAYAEVVLDGTLGFRGALNGPDYQIGAELGQQQGGNLFQSFSDFNLNTGESATFSGPNSVQNIMSRVTGGNPSHINGLIRSTIPNADLYFINPYGIMFGEDAALDVQGSFHATTADTLRLSDGGEFNARYPNKSLLTVAPVEAFGFITDSPASLSVDGKGLYVIESNIADIGRMDIRGQVLEELLENNKIDEINERVQEINYAIDLINENSTAIGINSNLSDIESFDDFEKLLNQLDSLKEQLDQMGLAVPVGKTLSLIAGKIRLNQAYLLAPSGRFNLASIASQGEVIPKQDDLILSGQRNKITMNDSWISTTHEGGGAIYIRNGHFELHNGKIEANTLGERDGTGIDIEADELTIMKGKLLSQVFESGEGGNIKINVTRTVAIGGEEDGAGYPSIIATSAKKSGNKGKVGDIIIQASELTLQDGARIEAITVGSGQSGHIKIQVTGSVIISGTVERFHSGIITASVVEFGDDAGDAGDAGHITLEAESLYLKEGTKINAATFGSGQANDITIKVTDTIHLSGGDFNGIGSIISSNSNSELKNAGNCGTITIEAGKLYLDDGGQIGSSNLGGGQGGNIHVVVAEEVILSGKSKDKRNGREARSMIGTYSGTGADYAGDAGDIILKTGKLILKEATLKSSTYGSGKGGDIIIQANSVVLSDKSGIFSTSLGTIDNAGNAGNIIIEGNSLILNSESLISSVTFGPGKGGDIKIREKEFINLDGDIFIASMTFGIEDKAGKGGSIELTSKELSLKHAVITSDSLADNEGLIGQGNAGDIIVNAERLRMQNSYIGASTEQAEGGQINMTSSNYLYLIDSFITTSVKADDGNSGNITLTPEFLVLDNSQIIAQAYEGRGGNIDITTTGIYNNTAQGIFESPLINAISASSELGIDGEIQINTPEIDITAGLFSLQTPFSKPQLDKGCTPSKLYNKPILKEGFRRAAVSKLLDTTWSSLYFSDNKTFHPENEETQASIAPFDEGFSLTKPVFGCHLGH